MIFDMKKWGASALVASIALVQVASATQAQTLWELQNTRTTAEVVKTDGEILSDAFVKTFNANFTATINSDIHADGVDIDWSGVKTEYIIDATAKNVFLKKSNNAFSYTANGANLDFSINSDNEDYPTFFPFKGTVNWSEQGVFDFEKFQFAFKSNINTLEIDNKSVNNVLAGGLEVYELFKNKWIALDFIALNEEFPELKTLIAGIQDDLDYELDIDGMADLIDSLAIGINFAVETGDLVIVKSGNLYTLTAPDSDITLVIMLNTNGTVSGISVNGEERWTNEWSYSEIESEEYSNVNVDVTVKFSYKTPVITFPIIEKQDFDITSFYKMYLEIEQADIIVEQKENQFYLDLNVFTGNANDAATYLLESGTKTDIIFVQNYIANAKNLNRNIRLRDLKELSVYALEEWDIEYLYDEIKYDVNGYNSNNRYDNKYTLETLLEAFDMSNIASEYPNTYHYIPWDIYAKLDILIDTRGDILILLAKIRKAEALQDAK